MSAVTTLATRDASPWGRIDSWFEDVWIMTRRNLIHVRREPHQLSDVTIQPILFTLLFVFIFGGAMVLPGGGEYMQFVLGGLLTMNLATSSVGTAIGLSTDLSTGFISRLRTLPMAQTSILVGRSVSDLLAAMLCSVFVAATGLAIGWRPDAGILSVLAGFGIALLFSYAFTWVYACLAMFVKGAEAVEGFAMMLMLALAVVSNSFVPTQGMPGWLGAIANWNPVSAVASAIRSLFGNPNPSATIEAWSMQHPVLTSVLWSAVLLAVCVPLAGWLFRRRTRD